MSRILVVVPALMLVSVHANAATDQECQSLWKTADVDANGSLSRSEDKNGYIASVEKGGGKLLQADTLSRDEFLSYCKTGFSGVATQSPANTKDFGKGDLTPGGNPLSKEDAMKKLDASGFKDVRNLSLDDKGIWRAIAIADGKDKFVAIDQQGDIVAQAGQSSMDGGSPAKADLSASAPAPDAAIRSGSGERSGLWLWLWIIIANAAGLALLNGVGGPTSSMGHGRAATSPPV
jgi:hypothetical protein